MNFDTYFCHVKHSVYLIVHLCSKKRQYADIQKENPTHGRVE